MDLALVLFGRLRTASGSAGMYAGVLFIEIHSKKKKELVRIPVLYWFKSDWWQVLYAIEREVMAWRASTY